MINYKDLPATDGQWRRFGDDISYSYSSCGWISELNGKRHNSLGPAVITDDGTKEWFIHGLSHRLDGPAYEGKSFTGWRINNKSCTFEQFSHEVIMYLMCCDITAALIIEELIEKST